jgi:hypothetical protein
MVEDARVRLGGVVDALDGLDLAGAPQHARRVPVLGGS